MKAHPSIAFNTLSGTAGEVTARETKNGTVLSSRAQCIFDLNISYFIFQPYFIVMSNYDSKLIKLR